MVADVIYETPDTTTLVFFTGNDHLDYKAGHFLTIDPHQFEALERFTAFLEDLKSRREPPRAYSMFSAPHEKYLAVTVKEERYASGSTKCPPLLSPLLVKRTTRGMRLTITGFTGPYTLPDDVESKTDHIVHLCAGSGSVPGDPPHLHLLEQELGRHHLPARAREPRRAAPRSSEGGPHPDAREPAGGVERPRQHRPDPQPGARPEGSPLLRLRPRDLGLGQGGRPQRRPSARPPVPGKRARVAQGAGHPIGSDQSRELRIGAPGGEQLR